MRLCNFEGCAKKHLARGWCTGHYYQWRQGRKMVTLRRVSAKGATSCAIEACDRPRTVNHKNMCLCNIHLKALRALSSAKNRCESPAAIGYEQYGGRGIECHFTTTYRDVTLLCRAIGEPKSDESLDRIDVNGHYEPGNLRWASWKTQAANRQAPTTREWVKIAERYPMVAELLVELRA